MQGKWTADNFEKYHEENPAVYEMFKKFSIQIAAKRERFSAKCIFHRVRWETAVGNYPSDYKIDDGWISHYARKFVKDFPQHKDFFQFRHRKHSYHD